MKITGDNINIQRNAILKDIGTGKISKEGFLKLFAAQLSNQDPMGPKDNSEYIAQMTQFSLLEQMQNLNSTIESLLASQKFQKGNLMIGKVVKVMVDDNTYIEGVVQSTVLSGPNVGIVVDDNIYDVDNVIQISDPVKDAKPEENPDNGGSEKDDV